MACEDVLANTAGEDGRVFVAVRSAHDVADRVRGLAGGAVGVGGDVVAFVEWLATDLADWVVGVEWDAGELMTT